MGKKFKKKNIKTLKLIFLKKFQNVGIGIVVYKYLNIENIYKTNF